MPLSKIESASLETAITAVDLAYTGTLTGGTGVVNLGSGQVYKDASGNVGIGTSSPATHAHISGTGAQAVRLQSTSTNGQSAAYQVYAPNSDGSLNQWQVGSGITADNEWTVQDITSAQIVDRYFRGAGGSRSFYVNGVERAKIDVNGQFSTPFVGGSTVVADYGCRAWIKHNSSSIQGSANISSLVRNGVGDYTINFTVAMADAGYAPTYMGEAGRIVSTTASAMNYARILDNGTTTDGPVGIAIFR